MNIDTTINALSSISVPGEAEHDPSKMTNQQVEEAILNIVGALRAFDTLLAILERAEFKSDDKQKAEFAARLVTERINWALHVLCSLKPTN
jgi:hypothetical protein